MRPVPLTLRRVEPSKLVERITTIMSLLRNTLKAMKAAAASHGLYINLSPPGMTKERHLKSFLVDQDIGLVIDVGAYRGEFASELRASGYDGSILSFEPVPSSFEQLRAKMSADPKWEGVNAGLSDAAREAKFNVYESGDFNSLLALKSDAKRAYSMRDAPPSEITVSLRRLDEVLPPVLKRLNHPKVFLKMDTQGHDLSVMRGATDVLPVVRGLLSELPAVSLYEGMPTMPEILSYYGECGFVPVGFYPVNTLDIHISPEFDVIFSRFAGKLQNS